MTRKLLTRLLAAAAALAGLAAAVTVFAGSGLAQGSAAQANYAPSNTAPPAIQGTPQVDQTLTATQGSWSAQSTPTFSYQWERCDSAGNGCAAIPGATAATYKVQSADVGHTLRVIVTARTSDGSTSAASAPTAVVAAAGPAGAIRLSNGKTSIPAASVTLPNRLVVDGVQYQPGVLSNRAPFQARFHVSDTRGFVVRDALVYALGIPYSWVRGGVEVRTDQTGWATLTITPTSRMPLARGALMVFVRARVEGQPLLAGSSTRRLTQVRINPFR